MSVTIDITIDHTKVPATLTDFPVYVDLSDMPADFWSTVTSSGGDIRVYRSDGTTECAREVVSCDTATDTGELHFLANSISHTVDTVFKITVDGTSSDYAVTDTYGRNAVWSDYEIVNHNNSGTDSTGKHNVTAGGGVTLGGVAGKLGQGTDFDGSNDSATHTATTLGAKGAFAVQFWCNPDTVSVRQGMVMNTNGASFAADSFGIEMGGVSGVLTLRVSTSSAASGFSTVASSAVMTTGTWQKVTGSRNGVNGKLYRNATEVGSSSTLPSAATNNLAMFGFGAFGIGAFLYYNGKMDEVRIANFEITANWDTTEYNNQNDPATFYSATVAGGGGGVVSPQFIGFGGL